MADLKRNALFGAAVLAATTVPCLLNSPAVDETAVPKPAAEYQAQLPHSDATWRRPINAALAAPAAQVSSQADDSAVRLAELFRFDVTPGWIIGRWPRVMAGPTAEGLQAYRVPLITGVGEADLAGSLTYYFDSQQQLQRITFLGATGNARPLVEHVQQVHELARQKAPQPGMLLYQQLRGSRPVSQLVVRPAPLLLAEAPHDRYGIELTLARPKARGALFSFKSGSESPWPF
jgi:hypothetical protein